MFLGDIPRRARLDLIEEVSKTARTLSSAGLRILLSAAKKMVAIKRGQPG